MGKLFAGIFLTGLVIIATVVGTIGEVGMKSSDIKFHNKVEIIRGFWAGCTATAINQFIDEDIMLKNVVCLDKKFEETPYLKLPMKYLKVIYDETTK